MAEGSQDYNESKYNPPSNPDDREGYDRDWTNAHATYDANNNEYRPDDHANTNREDYDKSWESTRNNNK